MIDGLRGEYNISTLVKSHDEVITYWTDYFGGSMTSLRKYNTDPTVAPKALHRFRPEDVHIRTGEGDRLQVTPYRGLALSADKRQHASCATNLFAEFEELQTPRPCVCRMFVVIA